MRQDLIGQFYYRLKQEHIFLRSFCVTMSSLHPMRNRDSWSCVKMFMDNKFILKWKLLTEPQGRRDPLSRTNCFVFVSIMSGLSLQPSQKEMIVVFEVPPVDDVHTESFFHLRKAY